MLNDHQLQAQRRKRQGSVRRHDVVSFAATEKKNQGVFPKNISKVVILKDENSQRYAILKIAFHMYHRDAIQQTS